jgi:hypothetical protein
LTDEVSNTERNFKFNANGTAGTISMAVIIFSVCAMVVGVCWAGAWLIVNL